MCKTAGLHCGASEIWALVEWYAAYIDIYRRFGKIKGPIFRSKVVQEATRVFVGLLCP
jgi:hypothetical protein